MNSPYPKFHSVIPVKLVLAKAGNVNPGFVPAKAGNQKCIKLDSCFHRKPWIPTGVYPVAERGRNDKKGG